jgi:hypothetical protein
VPQVNPWLTRLIQGGRAPRRPRTFNGTTI